MRKSGFETVDGKGDADALIVKKTIEYAANEDSVVGASDDTDILVLLAYHWREGMGEVYFSIVKENNKTKLLIL